jgi:hypothetical protein
MSNRLEDSIGASGSRNVPGRYLVAWFIAVAALQSASRSLVADVVTLKSGGAVHGKIVSRTPAEVAIRTQTNALIVVERAAIKQIGLASSAIAPARSFARKSAAAPAGSRLRNPTAREQAWLGRVRKLANRLFSDDRARSQ